MRRRGTIAWHAASLVTLTLLGAMLTLLGATLVGPTPAAAQTISTPSDMQTLQQAQQAEAEGDLLRAETLLRELLGENPSSLSAVLAMERLLRMQGRQEELLPLLGALLERDANSPIGHQLTLRTLSALDRPEELARAEERWIRATPDVETPYREAARVWLEREQHDRAIDVLERGRRRLGEDALAFELGGAHAAAGDAERAADEWQRAIGTDANRFGLVQRRLNMLPDGGATVTPRLIVALKSPPTTSTRVRSALALAIGAGLETEALELAQALEARLPMIERRPFLLETARQADAAREQRLAYWAYGRLVALPGADDDESVALRRRLAELAVAVGDSAQARRAYQQLADEADPGSEARRAAEAAAIELGLREDDLDRARRRLATFRSQYPDAPETDRLVGAVAGALLDAARGEDARALVEGVRGPRSSLVRARLALAAGEPAEARAALLTAAQALGGTEATETIALATLLGRVSPAGARRIAEADGALATGEIERALDVLVTPSMELRPDERAALLEHAVRIAEREALPVRAESIRRVIVDEHPRAQEAAGALLGLARALAERPGEAVEARSLLERLILEHPRSALVPQARRLLAELNQSIPRS